MEIISLDANQVKVKETMPRFRKEMGDVDSLAKSINRTGQLLPIIINRKHELIDGGRRLAACLLLNTSVVCVYQDTIDPYEMRMMELEANLHRKDYTPAEEAKAVEELHRLKQDQDPSHTLEDTAKILGKTKGSVLSDIKIAEMVKAFPNLGKAGTKRELTNAGKTLTSINTLLENVEKHKEEDKENQVDTLYTLELVDSIEAMPGLKANSVDIILTDPLYGIEHDKIMTSVGGKTGKGHTLGYTFDDSTDKALLVYDFLAQISFQFTTSLAHGYIFVAPEHYYKIRDLFMKVGWRVHVKPIIWVKNATGQCNVPSAWPASCYEMIMYIRKDNSLLIEKGKPDWIQCDPVLPSEKLHPYEKPVELLKDLLHRVCLPGQLVVDPFMGSGSAIQAATELGLRSIGYDNSKEAFGLANARMLGMKRTDAKEE